MPHTESAKPLLILGFTLIVAMVVVATVLSSQRLVQFREQLESVVADHNVRVTLSNRMQNSSRARTNLLHEMVMQQDPFLRDDTYIQFQQAGEEFLVAREELMSMQLNDEEAALLEQQSPLSQQAGNLQNEIIELLNSGKKDLAQHLLLERAIPVQNQSLALLNEFARLQEHHNENLLKSTRSRLVSTQWLIYLLGISLTIVSIVIASYIYLRITRMVSLLSDSGRELRAINISLKENERRERAIRENILEAIVTIDQQGRITSCNPAVETLFGYRNDELLGKNVALLMPEPHQSQHDAYIQSYLKTGTRRIIGSNREVQARKADGTLFPVDLGVTEIHQGGERHFIGVLRDVTQQRNAENALRKARDELEQRVAERTEELLKTNRLLRSEILKHEETQSRLAHMANHDPLTGLPNRTLFNEHLKLVLAKATRHQEQAALLYIDLDGFKPINDRLGHAAGDQVLQQVAERLTHTVREEDLVSRIGGDEFTVILGYSTDIRDEASRVAEKILDSLKAPVIAQGQPYQIGGSIGISLYQVDAGSADEMQRHADHAMYMVKRTGKGTFRFYTGSMDMTKHNRDAV